jgi:hypothetical protein
MAICFALAISVSGPRGFSMSLGPIAMDEPSALRVWAFAAVYVIALGVPMLSVFAKRNVLTR